MFGSKLVEGACEVLGLLPSPELVVAIGFVELLDVPWGSLGIWLWIGIDATFVLGPKVVELSWEVVDLRL